MSWINFNQSLNSLKGQITNFATEVLSEGVPQDNVEYSSENDAHVKELEGKCHSKDLEIAALKKLNEELQASLQSERLPRKNGVKEEESSWYWDPPPQSSKPLDSDIENQYKIQIQALQDELSTLKERDTIDLRPDAEEELNRLREENKNLTTNLEDLDSQHQLAMERLLILKKELQKNFEVLKQEHEDLKNTNDEYAAEIKTLSVRIEEKDNEIENMRATKSDYDTLYNKYQNLERIHSLLRENAEKFQEENQDLHEEVFKLQEQVTKLDHEIEIATKHSELSNMVPRESYEQLLKELSDLKDRRNSNQVHLDEINIDDNAKSVIENLKRDINDLRHKLSQKGSENHENADNKIVKSERIMQLYNKFVNFELPVDYVGEISTSDNTAFYKLECVFKTLNSFKKDIDTLEHKLSEKNLNINHLQTQIDDLTTENDFLNTDVQHLERELDEMKKNNDFLISEIAALKNTSKLEPIIETHEDNLAKLETELADCNRINKTFESEIKRIEKELFDVRSEKIKLQESLSDLKSKYTSMLNELEICKTQTKAVEELENSTNTEYIQKLKQASNEIDELKKRLNAANTKNEQLSIDIHIIENDKVLLTKQVDDLKHALEETSSAHKELEALKTSLEHKLQNLGSKLDGVIKHKMDVENDKSILEEKILTLENKLSSKEMDTSTNSKLEKIMIEKLELSAKLQEVKSENFTLKETVDKLRHDGQTLLTENNSLKNDGISMAQNVSVLKKTIEDLREKVGEQEDLSTQIIILKENNQKIVERNVQLETELTTADKKNLSLEQEFEKVMTDLNDKDNIIDHLNATITQNNMNITVLNQKIIDLENSIAIKNLDMENLTRSLTEVSEKLEDYSQKINQSHEEIDRYLKEKEEINQQISTLNEIINAKDMEISTLKNNLEHLEKTRIEYKYTIDNKDKEIKELNQSILEITDKIKITDNIAHQNDDYAKLIQEKETLEKEVNELKSNVVIKEQELVELKIKSDQLEKTCLEYKNVFDTATQEKAELINLVNLKHNESLQYHNEIQRLNHVILEQRNEFQKILQEKENLLLNNTESCSNCEKLRMSLKEKDEIIMTLNQNTNDYDKIKTELLNANEAVRGLTERCENLDKSLALQLETMKKLTAENAQLSEQEQNSSRELERLRHHLVETEENYTQELMVSESKLAECQTRLQQVEERAKQTSTVYTSNSIRANQEVETLRNQIRLLEKQREDVQAKLSDAEDARSRSEAALTNLQVVLEQFQLEKERDIQAATEKIRNKMEDLKRQNNCLQDEIARLNRKLEESLAGLQAATRLGDQVETKTAQINDLKEQVRTLHTSVAAAEERYYNAISNQQDKVDKNLVKNLVINYVMTAAKNSHNRTQVLRILSTVLDFNQQECERLGLVRSANSSDNSLAVEFVKFLQNESRPRATLPNMMGLAQSSSRSTTPVTPTSRSPGLSSQQNSHETSHKRNPSNGSNNLLFQNIESMETSSQASRESSEREPRVVAVTQFDTGVNQTRNTEGAILKHVLKDM